MKIGGTSGKKNFVFTFHSVCTVIILRMKTGCTSTMKKTFFIVEVCTVFGTILNGAFLIAIDYQAFT